MSILVHIGQPAWMRDETLRDTLMPLLPGVTIYCGAPSGVLPDVRMIALSASTGDAWAFLPNLELVQKLGAGVNQVVRDPALPPGVRIARLKPQVQAREIGEYCLAHVLRYQRNLVQHEMDAELHRWRQRVPRAPEDTTIAILGLGNIGAHMAGLFAGLGFRTIGWSRSPKTLEGTDCRAGARALPELLRESDYVIAVLPSTPETTDLFGAELLARMKPGSVLMNVGRGDLIVEDALLAALEDGPLAGAVLDVFRSEPLPPDDPLWDHPRITVTPHVSGWRVGGFEDVAENYRRLCDGRPLLHEIDREKGY